MCIRQAQVGDVARVNAFYAASGAAGRATESDTIVIAERDGTVVGAVRLCVEYGHLVLRGMRVREEDRGHGVGARMLHGVDALIGERPCYCLPHAHLARFYGQIGFMHIAEHNAPRHLQERLRMYREDGLHLIVMKRSSRTDPNAGSGAFV